LAWAGKTLAADGAANRTWLERHWDFARQWDRFWQPAIDQALVVAADRASARRAALLRRPATDVGVSVVVAALNEGALLRRTVDRFSASVSRNTEIIVVDDGSTDGCADFLTEPRNNVTFVRLPSRLGTARARNLGASHARGRIVLFSDAHVAVPGDWPEQLVSALADPDVGAAGPAIRAMRCPRDFDTETSATSREPRGFGMTWTDAGLRTTWLATEAIRTL